MPKISVILPTYNERDNIQPLISEIFSHLKGDVEVIVVDDASPDRTWERAQEISQENKNVKVLKRKKKLGVASAISEGISLAGGDILAWMDADHSMPPRLLPEMVRALTEGDVVVGSRYASGASDKRGSLMRKITSKAINALASLLLNGTLSHFLRHRVSKDNVLDYTSGFIATRRRVCDEIPIRGICGEYCIDFLHNCKLRGLRIVEIPFESSPRRSGNSKIAANLFGLLRHGVRYFITIVRLRFETWRKVR